MTFKNTFQSPFWLRCALMAFALMIFSAQLDAAKKSSKINIVSRVDHKAHTFMVGGKLYVMSDRFSITVNGKKADLSKIKVGMRVSITARVVTYGKKGEDNVYEAKRVAARTVKK